MGRSRRSLADRVAAEADRLEATFRTGTGRRKGYAPRLVLWGREGKPLVALLREAAAALAEEPRTIARPRRERTCRDLPGQQYLFEEEP